MNKLYYLQIQAQQSSFIYMIVCWHASLASTTVEQKKEPKKSLELTPTQTIYLIITALAIILLSFALSPILEGFSILLLIPIFLILADAISRKHD